MKKWSWLFMVLLTSCVFASCGPRGGGAGVVTGGTPRPGGAVDLMALVPSNALVVLHANLALVRQDPVRYDRIASELATELGLSSEAGTVHALLDLTDDAVGVFAAGGGGQHEGMLVFSGRYSDADFQTMLRVAGSRHGSTPPPSAAASGQMYVMGNATLVQLDQWTWALVQGAGLRDHISRVTLGGGRQFGQNLLEFGPRIGLPNGATQAWANQDQQVGVDMVGLVFAGENPQMVRNFVTTVMRHLGLSGF